MHVPRPLLISICLCLSPETLLPQAAAPRAPVIDMHVHAQRLWLPAGTVDSATGLRVPTSADELRKLTLETLERYNVVRAVVSGPLAQEYRAAAPGRVLAGPLRFGPDTNLDSLRAAFESGRYQVLAEFAPQYAGLPPNAPELEPFYALAEELDVPLGIHVGPAGPGAAYRGSPRFRMAHGNPLLLEDVLVRHPRLRVYVMHAGWPFADEMVGLMYAHPQVYAEIGVIDWFIPRPEFHAYLRRLVEAGFGRRILFGSDQMLWPDAIGRAIDAVESAEFLSDEQKRDILYNNAARFLRLPDSPPGR